MTLDSMRELSVAEQGYQAVLSVIAEGLRVTQQVRHAATPSGCVGVSQPRADYSRALRSRSALTITLTEDSAMAAAASMGDSSQPSQG